jgi:hypothetical protein
MSMRIVFTEASAHYTINLLENTEGLGKKIINELTSIENCGRYIIKESKKMKITMGDMTVDQIKCYIHDYYHLDHAEIALAKEAKSKKSKLEKGLQKAKVAEIKKKTQAPTQAEEQLNLFGGGLNA